MQEIFKDITGYEGLYQVSNLGNVKSLGNNRLRKEKILKPCNGGVGYYFVNLWKDGEKKNITVHQLVAIAFLNHKPDGHKIIVDHIDNNPLNNKLENLQLISVRENTSKDRINGSSKYIGVYWNKKANKWQAQIGINSKRKYLGLFSNEIEAHESYQNRLKQLNQIKNK